MPEPARRSALAGHVVPGEHGAVGPEGPGVIVAEARPDAIVLVNGAPAEAALGERLGAPGALAARRAAEIELGGARTAWLWSGPGQWLVVGEGAGPERLVDDLGSRLADDGATVTDLSHARTVVRLGGPAAREVIAAGCPLDVDRMGAGDCAATLLGHFNVHLHWRGDGEVDVYVFRSLGLALWEWVLERSLEHGCRIEG